MSEIGKIQENILKQETTSTHPVIDVKQTTPALSGPIPSLNTVSAHTAFEQLSSSALNNKSRFDTRQYDEEKLLEINQRHEGVSNEPSLYETFSYIKNLKGVGLGVGLDQMFDIAANSQLDELYVIDVVPSTSLVTRAFLEVGVRHYERFGSYPKPSEFVNYFAGENLDTTIQIIGNEFTEKERALLNTTLHARMKQNQEQAPSEEDPLEIYRYLQYKITQPDYRSWLSSDANLQKVLKMYQEGKLKVVLGDLTGNKSVKTIASSLKERHLSLSLIYLSNAEQYLGLQWDKFEDNFYRLPVNDSTLVISTIFGSDMPIPQAVTQDPYLRNKMLSWTYLIQTMQDRNQARKKPYRYKSSDGKIHLCQTPSARLEAVRQGVSEEYMRVREAKKGLIVAGTVPAAA